MVNEDEPISDPERIRQLERELEDLRQQLRLEEEARARQRGIRRWIANMGFVLVAGPGLTDSLREVIAKVRSGRKLEDSELADLLAAGFRRYVRVGLVTLLVLAAPGILALVQTSLAREQNRLLQTELVLTDLRHETTFLSNREAALQAKKSRLEVAARDLGVRIKELIDALPEESEVSIPQQESAWTGNAFEFSDRNVRQVCCFFGSGVCTMYLATVDSATSCPSNVNSDWTCGAPHSGFSFDRRRTR
jgi:hypothetical protein